MDDVPEEELRKVKNDYIININNMLEKCNDVGLLDFILSLLVKTA